MLAINFISNKYIRSFADATKKIRKIPGTVDHGSSI